MEVLDKIKAGEAVTGAEVMGALGKEFDALLAEGLVDIRGITILEPEKAETVGVVATVLNILDARRKGLLITCDIH